MNLFYSIIIDPVHMLTMDLGMNFSAIPLARSQIKHIISAIATVSNTHLEFKF